MPSLCSLYTVVSHRLAGHTQHCTAAVDRPGALRLEEQLSGGSSRSPALVRASAAPAGPHPTTRIARPLLRLSAVSLDARSLMGIQADLPPAHLHRQNAQGCDLRVVSLLRERALGNSATQLYTKLCEGHSEAWMRRAMQYLGECEPFLALGTGSFHHHHQPCRRCPHRHG